MKKLVVILAAALLATGVIATRLWQQLRSERELSAALQARVDANQVPAFAVRAPMPALVTSTGGSPKPVAPAAPGTARPPIAQATDALAKALNNSTMTSEESRNVRRAQLLRQMPTQYPDIGKQLHLSPDEVNKLFELLATQGADQMEMFSQRAGAGGAPDTTTIQERALKAQELRRTSDTELSAMLGSKYPQYQEYQQSLPDRRQVDQLQTMLGTGANALGDTQSNELIAALAAERTRSNQERVTAPPQAPGTSAQEIMQQQFQRTEENNRHLLDVASTRLNPQQLDSYKRMLDQQQNLNRALLGAINQQAATQGQATAPTKP